MTIRIHHTQHKQAAKFGLSLTAEMGDDGTELVVARNGNGKAFAGVSGTDAIALAVQELGLSAPKSPRKVKSAKPKKPRRRVPEEDEDDYGEFDGEEDEGEEENSGKSVVKKKYKRQYKPFKAKCGDELSIQITKHLSYKDDEDGKTKIDQDKLERFAKANGVWAAEYKHLNGGMRRMNIANRLRGKVRSGHKVVWAV